MNEELKKKKENLFMKRSLLCATKNNWSMMCDLLYHYYCYELEKNTEYDKRWFVAICIIIIILWLVDDSIKCGYVETKILCWSIGSFDSEI